MLDFVDVMSWVSDPSQWSGRYGLLNLVFEHLGFTALSLIIAGGIGIPLGFFTGRTRRGEFLVLGLGSLSRAVPTMGLLFALVLAMGVQFRELAILLALSAIAIPPILAGTYSGVVTIPRGITDAAVAQGMTRAQLLRFVNVPLARSSIVGGVRLAYIQVVSTVVLAPLVGLGGLGFGIVQGLALRNFPQVIASALLIIAVTLAGDSILGYVQRRTGIRL